MLPIAEELKKLLVNETRLIAIKSLQNLLKYPIDNKGIFYNSNNFILHS
jgi:hypothetical protein